MLSGAKIQKDFENELVFPVFLGTYRNEFSAKKAKKVCGGRIFAVILWFDLPKVGLL